MTQVKFQETTAAAFDFVADATAALIDFLASSNANENLNSLGDYFSAAGVMFRASTFDEPSPNESPKNYPLAYIKSTPVRVTTNSKALWIHGQSIISVWVSRPNPVEAGPACAAVAGAIASKCLQAILDGNATDWSQFYSNDYPDPVVNRVSATGVNLETDSQGMLTGRASTKLTMFWSHNETL